MITQRLNKRLDITEQDIESQLTTSSGRNMECCRKILPDTCNIIEAAIELPKGESLAGWIALYAIDFYTEIETIWAVIAAGPYVSSFQPNQGFPPNVLYLWPDNGKVISVSAPKYIEKVLRWVEKTINDETKFPDCDADTNKLLSIYQTPEFASLCVLIYRRLLRVYGILYSSFFGLIESLDMVPHLNTCFRHFMFFNFEYNLLPEREVKPLAVLVEPIRRQYLLTKLYDYGDDEYDEYSGVDHFCIDTHIGQIGTLSNNMYHEVY